jgi:ribosomal protein L20A (L18A)
MDIDNVFNTDDEDLSDEQLQALVLGEHSLDPAELKKEVRELKDRLSTETFYRLWDEIEARIKLGLAYYRLAHADENPKHFRKALDAFKYAWNTDYRYSECGASVLQRLISLSRTHLHMAANEGLKMESSGEEPAPEEISSESPHIHLCKACLGRWG